MIYIERIRSALSELKPELRKPWVILDRLPYIHATDDPSSRPYSTPVVGRFDYMESADYIMACNPDAMSNVLAYVAALKAERDELLAALQGVATMSRCGQLDRFIGEPWLNAVFAAIAKVEGGAA